jgi:hypothetical protein
VQRVVLEDINPALRKQAAFRVRQENISTLKGKQYVSIVKLDDRLIL